MVEEMSKYIPGFGNDERNKEWFWMGYHLKRGIDVLV